MFSLCLQDGSSASLVIHISTGDQGRKGTEERFIRPIIALGTLTIGSAHTININDSKLDLPF